jgi:hypothetical protein
MAAYFLVRIGRCGMTTALGSLYRGMHRSPWECVDEAFHAHRLPSEFMARRRASFKNFAGNLSFGTFGSPEDVRELAMSCACSPADTTILSVKPLGTVDEVLDDNEVSSSLGFDAYVDGYGSPIALGIDKIGVQLPELTPQITKAGLLNSATNIRSFWRKYVELTGRLDLELSLAWGLSGFTK